MMGIFYLFVPNLKNISGGYELTEGKKAQPEYKTRTTGDFFFDKNSGELTY